MKRITIGLPGLGGAALAILVGLVTFAPAAIAGDLSLDGGSLEDFDMRFKFGASGQAYIWRSGGC